MGTLFNQTSRKDYFDNDAVKFFHLLKTHARDHGLTVEETFPYFGTIYENG